MAFDLEVTNGKLGFTRYILYGLPPNIVSMIELYYAPLPMLPLDGINIKGGYLLDAQYQLYFFLLA